MHQGHVSKPVSSDPFPPSHKWYHPNIESDIINEEQYLPLPLVVQMGLGPFDPSFSVQWEGTTQPVQLCPKDLGPVSPLPVCRTHMGVGGEGREGGSQWSQCWEHFYNLLRGCSPCTLRRLHGRAEPSCCPLSGYRQAACCLHRKPLLHMQVIRFHEQLFLWFFFFLSRISVQFP